MKGLEQPVEILDRPNVEPRHEAVLPGHPVAFDELGYVDDYASDEVQIARKRIKTNDRLKRIAQRAWVDQDREPRQFAPLLELRSTVSLQVEAVIAGTWNGPQQNDLRVHTWPTVRAEHGIPKDVAEIRDLGARCYSLEEGAGDHSALQTSWPSDYTNESRSGE